MHVQMTLNTESVDKCITRNVWRFLTKNFLVEGSEWYMSLKR